VVLEAGEYIFMIQSGFNFIKENAVMKQRNGILLPSQYK
jgi:hypothetical protein